MNNGKISKLIMLLTAMVFAVCSFSMFAFADEDSGEVPEVSYRAAYDGYALERIAVANPFDYVIKHTVIGEDETDEKLSAKEVTEFKVYESNAAFNTELTEDLLVDDGYKFDEANGTITYVYKDGATLKDDDENEGVVYYYKAVVVIGEDDEKTEIVTNVKVLAYAPAITYKDFDVEENAELLAVAREAVESSAESLSATTTSYTLPNNSKEMWNLINSPVYANASSLKIMLYVAKPNSSFPTSATSTATSGTYPTISLSASGTYRFWVLYSNAEYNPDYLKEMTTDGLTYKEDGWYDDNKLIIPVFSFDYVADKSVSVTPSGGGEGIKNYTYNGITFSVKNGSVTGWKLLYTNKVDAEGNPVFSDDGEATNEQAEYDLDEFSPSSISFKPLATGYFKVRCYATGSSEDKTVVKDSAVVYVTREYEEVKLVDTRFRDFMANNWKSLIFLGLAVLSLVGIIIVALYKPKAPDGKKQKREKAVVKETEEKTEEAKDEVAAETPAEEAVEDEQPTTEQPAAEQSIDEQPAADEAPADEAPADEPVAEQPAEEQPEAEQSTTEEPVEQPAVEQPSAEQPAEEQPEAEQPVEENAPAEAEAQAEEKENKQE